MQSDVMHLANLHFWIVNSSTSAFVFQSSSANIWTKLRKRMEEFAETDPLIYTLNDTIHLQRVIQGGYAYIGDTTSFEVEMSKTCNIDMIRDQFVPEQYSVALWKNSAYWKVVNAE